MKKQINQLIPGDVFTDDFEFILEVEKIHELPRLDIPDCPNKTRVFFITEKGHHMAMNFPSNRIVRVLKCVS